MQYIQDKSGKTILAFDGDNLYFRSQEPDEDSELDESISIEQLRVENNGGLKFYTILGLQKELNIISDIKYIITKVKKTVPYLAQIILEHEKSISLLKKRIILLKMEVSGPASAGMLYLFLLGSNKTFDLCSSSRGYISAAEIIEYYGLGENDYWDQIQANGEFIEERISSIKNAKELREGIVLCLKTNEQWNHIKIEINWSEIVITLLQNKLTHKLGLELKSINTND